MLTQVPYNETLAYLQTPYLAKNVTAHIPTPVSMINPFSVILTLVLNATDMTLIMIKNGSTMSSIMRCMDSGVAA